MNEPSPRRIRRRTSSENRCDTPRFERSKHDLSIQIDQAVGLGVGVEIGPDAFACISAQAARFLGVVEQLDDGGFQGDRDHRAGRSGR